MKYNTSAYTIDRLLSLDYGVAYTKLFFLLLPNKSRYWDISQMSQVLLIYCFQWPQYHMHFSTHCSAHSEVNSVLCSMQHRYMLHILYVC